MKKIMIYFFETLLIFSEKVELANEMYDAIRERENTYLKIFFDFTESVGT